MPPTGVVVALSPGGVCVTWQDNSNREQGFEVEMGGRVERVPANVTAYLFEGVRPRELPCASVRAYNAAGGSEWSRECATSPGG